MKKGNKDRSKIVEHKLIYTNMSKAVIRGHSEERDITDYKHFLMAASRVTPLCMSPGTDSDIGNHKEHTKMQYTHSCIDIV